MLSNSLGRFRLLLICALVAALILCLAISWSTRQAMSQLPPAQPDTAVDLRPWQMAEALAALATSAEESEYAREAEHLADHEVDQAFAAALRQATLHRPTLSGDALNLSRNVERLQQVVAADQARVHALTQQDPGDDLDIAKAQLGLDADQLSEAQQDLARAGGDERGRIKQELATHEAAMHAYDAQAAKPTTRAIAASQVRNTVATSLIAWLEERPRWKLLQTSAAEAQAAAEALTVQHNQLEKTAIPTPAATGKTARLASLSDQSTRSQLQGIYDDRIATERQLATVYG